MGIRHNYQSATANNAGSEVSSTRWNEDHVIDTKINLPGQSADPGTLVDGDLWHNSSTNRLKARLNGTTSDLAFLAEVVTLSGAQAITSQKTFNNTAFQIRDATDNTKIAQFAVNAITSGTTRYFSLPNADTTLAGLSVQNTFTSPQIFVNDNNSFGTGSATGTINLASGATNGSSTKTVNIGTGGLSGSTTNITLGSSVAGALGNLAINSPTITLGSNVTSFTIPDNVLALYDNADATKQGKFELSGLPTGTIRTVNWPNGNGTMALLEIAQTWLAKQTFGPTISFTGQTTDPSASDGDMWFDSFLQGPKFEIGTRARDILADWINSGSMAWKASPGQGSGVSLGAPPTLVGTATASAMGGASRYNQTPKLEALVSTAATTAVASFRCTTAGVVFGNSNADLGGFRACIIWAPGTAGITLSTLRLQAGLINGSAAPTDVNPSTIFNQISMGCDSGDANLQMMFNGASGTATKVDLGASFPRPSANATNVYKLEIYVPKGSNPTVYYRVTEMVSGAVAQGTFNTASKLPAAATVLVPKVYASVGGTSSTIGVCLCSWHLDPLL